MMMSSLDMKKLEIYDTSIGASWTWATLDMVMGYFWKSLTLDPTGSFHDHELDDMCYESVYTCLTMQVCLSKGNQSGLNINTKKYQNIKILSSLNNEDHFFVIFF